MVITPRYSYFTKANKFEFLFLKTAALQHCVALVAMIFQVPGHSSLRPPEITLAGFEDDQLRDATSVLMRFEKEEIND